MRWRCAITISRMLAAVDARRPRRDAPPLCRKPPEEQAGCCESALRAGPAGASWNPETRVRGVEGPGGANIELLGGRCSGGQCQCRRGSGREGPEMELAAAASIVPVQVAIHVHMGWQKLLADTTTTTTTTGSRSCAAGRCVSPTARCTRWPTASVLGRVVRGRRLIEARVPAAHGASPPSCSCIERDRTSLLLLRLQYSVDTRHPASFLCAPPPTYLRTPCPSITTTEPVSQP
jgi:hypothetical protein